MVPSANVPTAAINALRLFVIEEESDYLGHLGLAESTAGEAFPYSSVYELESLAYIRTGGLLSIPRTIGERARRRSIHIIDY